MQPYGSFDNYIESLRKQSGLTQNDIAVLLSENRQRICEYEAGTASPRVRAVIALELIFGEPVQRIFAGITERKRKEVAGLAWTLIQSTSDQVDGNNAERLQTLHAIVTASKEDFTTWKDAA
jgi:transcriptional regulator with XRE-family HTH domain